MGLRLLPEGTHLFAYPEATHPPVEAVLRRLQTAVTDRGASLGSGHGEQWLDWRVPRRAFALPSANLPWAEKAVAGPLTAGEWSRTDHTTDRPRRPHVTLLLTSRL